MTYENLTRHVSLSGGRACIVMAFCAALACFPGKSPIAAESEAQAGYELSSSSDSSTDSSTDSY
ncbi:hypothetical protein N8993_14470, partial [Pseudomonadales bacterium]|nr:hypothetical protein [Pseudomonadales bacterium]